MADLKDSMFIAGAGMQAQNLRMRVISENIANADSTADTPGGDPYRRKTITFKNVLDKQIQADVVKVKKIGTDPKPFETEYAPGNPAADAEGYIKRPNVDPTIEMADMREAQRSYEANLSVIEVTRGMINRTLDLMR
jgi:flagellar basal-body rod protein FlgC